MIAHRFISAQRMPELSSASGHHSSIVLRLGQVAFEIRRWLVNRRDLRGLDRDQMRDTGLTREMIEEACSFGLRWW